MFKFEVINFEIMCSTKLIFTILICLKSIYGQWAVDDDGCITPFRNSGSCVGIYECNPIVLFLRNAQKPLSSNNMDLLRRYQCGYQQNSVKVCCPRNADEIQRITNSNGNSGVNGGNGSGNNNNGNSNHDNNNNNGNDRPPDVSRHRNLRLLPENCGHINIDSKIINGNETGLFEFPWMALLSYRLANGPEFRCGGSIINDRYILTAAHCIAGLRYPLLGVRVGEHDLRTQQDCETVNFTTTCAPPVQDIGIARTIPHPRYNRSAFTDDIGLIRLSRRINFSENIAPVCLPVTLEAAMYNFTGRHAIVTGFGATETGRNSQTLLKVRVPYIERDECRRVYRNAASITTRQICAGGRNRQDSCGGDSGGPLQIAAPLYDEARYVQHGITSFGPRNCGAEGNPGVYTRVGYYMDWILDNIST